MRDTFLNFSPPCVGEEEIAAISEVVRSKWLSTGPKTREFEEMVASYVNAPSTLALNSCTAGLHVALIALGIGPNDEVITTPMTFASSVNVIEHVGARPVLADVEPDTLNIDPEEIERVISSRTKAIMPVHYAGCPVNLDRICELALIHSLNVVEDAAHAISAKYKGRWIGSGDNPAVFSFYATKNLTTGEGGMLTGSPDFIDKARVISLHGMSKDAWKRYDKGGSWFYEILLPGFKYNMTDIQAALGIAQLLKLEDFQHRRREIAVAYNEAFSNEECLELPTEPSDVEHAWHLYVLRLRLDCLSIDRNQFIEELHERNIGTSVHFIPIHIHPYYRDKYGFEPQDYPIAFSNYKRIISLPLNPGLSDEDVNDVIEAVLDTCRRYRR